MELVNVIDYGQYDRNVCPGCGRCRDCGRIYSEPLRVPAPLGPPVPWMPSPWKWGYGTVNAPTTGYIVLSGGSDNGNAF